MNGCSESQPSSAQLELQNLSTLVGKGGNKKSVRTVLFCPSSCPSHHQSTQPLREATNVALIALPARGEPTVD